MDEKHKFAVYELRDKLSFELICIAKIEHLICYERFHTKSNADKIYLTTARNEILRYIWNTKNLDELIFREIPLDEQTAYREFFEEL